MSTAGRAAAGVEEVDDGDEEDMEASAVGTAEVGVPVVSGAVTVTVTGCAAAVVATSASGWMADESSVDRGLGGASVK